MQKFFSFIKNFFQKRNISLVIVGAQYPSYALCEKIKAQSKKYCVRFFIDEEPWNHRTVLCDAQLRYPAELLALVNRFEVKAVLCTTEEDFEKTQREFGERLCRVGCGVLLVDGFESWQGVEEQIVGLGVSLL
ncbi:MAG: hypothetical protein JKY66_01865 [Spongiibacteraceae bacterium]|nr:hypothetical protein [Spongiibacteraceae bacterium]